MSKDHVTTSIHLEGDEEKKKDLAEKFGVSFADKSSKKLKYAHEVTGPEENVKNFLSHHYAGAKFAKMVHPDVFKESIQEESAAADTLKPNGAPGDKMQVLAALAGQLAVMKNSEAVEFFNKMMAQVDQKDWGVPDVAAKNAASIAMKKTVKEGVADLFEGEDLTEEFKERTATLFESAVAAAVALETADLAEAFEQKLSEEVERIQEETVSNIDAYLDYVVENWMKQNEVAVESALRTELTMDFINGLKNLFAESYIDLPEEKVDVVEALVAEKEELQAKLNETIETVAAQKQVISESQKQRAFEELAEGLTLTQVEKFATLAEAIEFDGDVDAYSRKLTTIKEHYFTEKKAPVAADTILNESFEGEEAPKAAKLSPSMQRYASVIKKTAKTA